MTPEQIVKVLRYRPDGDPAVEAARTEIDLAYIRLADADTPDAWEQAHVEWLAGVLEAREEEIRAGERARFEGEHFCKECEGCWDDLVKHRTKEVRQKCAAIAVSMHDKTYWDDPSAGIAATILKGEIPEESLREPEKSRAAASTKSACRRCAAGETVFSTLVVESGTIRYWHEDTDERGYVTKIPCHAALNREQKEKPAEEHHRFENDLLAQRVVAGLQAQGHIPTIERMLQEGKSWAKIAAAINWDEETARKHYRWYVEGCDQDFSEGELVFMVGRIEKRGDRFAVSVRSRDGRHWRDFQVPSQYLRRYTEGDGAPR